MGPPLLHSRVRVSIAVPPGIIFASSLLPIGVSAVRIESFCGQTALTGPAFSEISIRLHSSTTLTCLLKPGNIPCQSRPDEAMGAVKAWDLISLRVTRAKCQRVVVSPRTAHKVLIRMAELALSNRHESKARNGARPMGRRARKRG